MKIEIKTIKGVTAIYFTRNGKTKDVIVTDNELLDMQEQIVEHFRGRVMQESYKSQADAIILEKDPNFVDREIRPRVYSQKTDTFYEVRCETKSEIRIWMFDIKDNKLNYRTYEGDFKG